MKVVFSPAALADLEYWKKTGNTAILKRIQLLLKSIQQAPFDGIGKPEALKHDLSGFWSRRINQEHRIVYQVTDEAINIIQLRFHY
jgi:toxin YoeB